MKQTKRNKLITVVTMLTLVVTTVLASSSMAFAAKGPEVPIETKIKSFYYPLQKSNLYTGNAKWVCNPGDYKIDMEKTTVDDPTVVKLNNEDGLTAIALKPGKTTIHVYAKEKGTKEYRYFDVKFIAEKYINPAKTFKIGKKNYVKKFKKAEQYWKNSKKISGKLVVKAKKGWKITKIRKAGYNITPKKIKNGKKVTLTGKNPQSVVVTFKNKKTKQKIELVFVVIKAAG